MVALTQLTPHAGPGQRYGSFAGKEADSGVPPGPHNPGTITQLRPYAGPGGRYGSFAGKEASAVTPTPTPAPTAPSGGWVYDPYSRRRRRRDDEGEPPPSVPVIVPDRPRVDIAALDAKIAALGEQIQRSRRGRIKLREQLRALEVERAIQIGLERRLRLLRDDDEWFLLS